MNLRHSANLRRSRRRHRSRGFIFFLAVLMIAFVGAAMLAMGTTVSVDARRTVRHSNEAQLDQLLLAGITDAKARLDAAAPISGVSWTIGLPTGLAATPASLKSSILSTDDTQTTARITATFADQSGSQTVRFRHDPDGWKLISAELD